MKRKLLVATISYIIGIIIGVYLSKSIPFFIVLGILFIVYFIIKNKESKSFFIINILIFLIASIYVSKKNFEYENKYLELNNTNIQIIGTVVDNANRKENYSTFTIKVNENKKYSGDYLIVNYKGNLDIKYGNKVLILGTYEEPNGSRNYKGFNYKNYLKTKKVYGIISTKNIRIIKKRNVNIIDFYINRIKEKISNNLNKILPLEKALLAYSILLGKTNDLPEEIEQSFKNSNLSHMLAISGTHVSYIIIAIFIIFNKKIIGIKKQKIIIIIFMIFL